MKDSEFDNIISGDMDREDNLLLPLMQDPRVGKAVIASVLPQLSIEVDLDQMVKEMAVDYKVDESLVLEAYERAKGKFEREQEHGF